MNRPKGSDPKRDVPPEVDETAQRVIDRYLSGEIEGPKRGERMSNRMKQTSGRKPPKAPAAPRLPEKLARKGAGWGDRTRERGQEFVFGPEDRVLFELTDDPQDVAALAFKARRTPEAVEESLARLERKGRASLGPDGWAITDEGRALLARLDEPEETE